MDMPLDTTVGLALLASLIALLITSLLFALRSSRRAVHLSPALRRLAKPVVLLQSQIVDGKHFPLTLSPVDANAGPAARIALACTFRQEILTLEPAALSSPALGDAADAGRAVVEWADAISHAVALLGSEFHKRALYFKGALEEDAGGMRAPGVDSTGSLASLAPHQEALASASRLQPGMWRTGVAGADARGPAVAGGGSAEALAVVEPLQRMIDGHHAALYEEAEAASAAAFRRTAWHRLCGCCVRDAGGGDVSIRLPTLLVSASKKSSA